MPNYFRSAFQCQGLWWIPGNESEVFSGELRYEPDSGLLLTLMRSAPLPRELRSDNALPSYEVLLGRVVDCPLGHIATLTGCVARRALHVLFGSLGTEELVVRRAFFGADLPAVEDRRFDRVDIYVDQLTNWIAASTMKMGIEFEGERPTTHSVEFSEPPRMETKIDGCQLEIGFLRTLPLGFARSVTVGEEPYFRVAYSEAQDIDVILRDTVFPLQNLSTFASDHVSELTGVELCRMSSTGERERITMLFRQVPERFAAVRFLYAEEMLFTTADISFERIATSWLRFARRYADLCDLYFSVLYGRGLLPDAAFSMLMQVAEAYHRERYPGTEIPLDEYENKKKAIVESAPEAYRGWLSGKLLYANEPTLRKRLRGLLSEDGEALMPVISDFSAFIEKLVNTRNYMAHRTEELLSLAARGVELHYLSARLRILLKLCLLRELGCSIEERKAIVARHLRFSPLRR